jgi:type II secretory pathway pseudopilin PulG
MMRPHASLRRENRRRRGGGFTLVELLVVIGIIVLLIAIIFPVVNGLRRNAARSRARMDLHTIELGLDAYKQVFHDYPRQFAPDWSNGRTAPERVLAKYLLGWDPDPNNDGNVTANEGVIDFNGVRGASLNKGKKWGPYIPPEKFKVKGANVGAPSGITSIDGDLLDADGNEIQYYPRWNSSNPNLKDSLIGGVTRKAVGSGVVARFNLRDGGAYNDPLQKEHILYMLGDGIPDTRRKSANDYNNQIDPPNEKLQFEGDYILISPGPDRSFGLQAGDTRHDKVDDVFNFERQQ